MTTQNLISSSKSKFKAETYKIEELFASEESFNNLFGKRFSQIVDTIQKFNASDHESCQTENDEYFIELEKFNKVNIPNFLKSSNLLTDQYRAKWDILKNLIIFDLTDEKYYKSSNYDNKNYMETLSYLFYIQRKFLINPCTYTLINDNLDGNLKSINALHLLMFKNHREQDLEVMGSYYPDNAYGMYEIPQSILQNDKDYEKFHEIENNIQNTKNNNVNSNTGNKNMVNG